MRLISTAPIANLFLDANNPFGKFGAFLIRFAGTAQAGQTVTLADLGTIVFNWDGDDKVNAPFSFLSQAGNLYGGVVESVSNIGGTFAFSVIIPAGLWNDKNNCYYFEEGKDTAYWKLNFPAMIPALVATGSVSIYALPAIGGVQNYIHKITTQTVISAGAGQVPGKINVPNIVTLYLDNPTALIDNSSILIDGKLRVSGDIVSELSYSNFIHNVETPSTLLAWEFMVNSNLRNAVNKQTEYTYNFTGVGNLGQYTSSIEFTPDKQIASLR